MDEVGGVDGGGAALAASLLRRILVDLARRRQASKRGGGYERTTLSGVAREMLDEPTEEVDLLDLDAALQRLEKIDPRQHRIVELRFFAGLTGQEIADLLEISRPTVVRELTMARAWLRRELKG